MLNTWLFLLRNFFSFLNRKLFFLFFFLFIFSFSIQNVFAQTQQELLSAGCTLQAGPNVGFRNVNCPAESGFQSQYQCRQGVCSVRGATASVGLEQANQALDTQKQQCEKDGLVWNGQKCAEKVSSCVSLGGISIAACLSWLADLIIGWIAWGINLVLSYILGFAFWALDVVIYITVIKFKTNFVDLNLQGLGGIVFADNSGASLINYIWGIIRDFVNLLLLITILVYAVRTMIDGLSEHRNKFIFLLIFSILVNFSLFFVKFAIDLSNILMLQTFTLMARPASFDDWKSFRTNAKGQQIGLSPVSTEIFPSTMGEYLINVANVASIHKVDVADKAARDRIVEGMKKSWAYQVVVLMILLGLIYLTFYIIGILIMRALAFLYAMLVAPLLAADIFFNTFLRNKDEYEFAESIKRITDNIRGDFYDALIKGPVLFFFLFLVGVLANAIFNQSIASEISKVASDSNEFKVLGSSFGSSIAILLKFAVFFALCKVLFEKLNAIKFGENGSWVGARAGKLANFAFRNTVGRAARLPGFVGRNYIARGVDKPGWRNSVYQWANRQATSLQNRDGFLGVFTKPIGSRINQSLASVRSGTYEYDQSRFGQWIGGKFAKTELGKAISASALNTDRGKYSGLGYREGEEQKVKDIQEKRKKESEIIKAAMVANSEDYRKAKSNTTFQVFPGFSMSLADLESLTKDPEKRKKIMEELESGSSIKLELANGTEKELTSKDEMESFAEFLENYYSKTADPSKKRKYKDIVDTAVGNVITTAEENRDARATTAAENFEYEQRPELRELLTDYLSGSSVSKKVSGDNLRERARKRGQKYQVVSRYIKGVEDVKNLLDQAEIDLSGNDANLKGKRKEIKDLKVIIEGLGKQYFTEGGDGLYDKDEQKTIDNFANNSYWLNDYENNIGEVVKTLRSIYRDENVQKGIHTSIRELEEKLERAKGWRASTRRDGIISSLTFKIGQKKRLLERLEQKITSISDYEKNTKEQRESFDKQFGTVRANSND